MIVGSLYGMGSSGLVEHRRQQRDVDGRRRKNWKRIMRERDGGGNKACEGGSLVSSYLNSRLHIPYDEGTVGVAHNDTPPYLTPSLPVSLFLVLSRSYARAHPRISLTLLTHPIHSPGSLCWRRASLG